MTDQPKVILVVDDDPDNLELLARIFRGKYETVAAKDGSEALAILKTRSVDVIVTDQRMPRMSGTELLAASLAIAPQAVKIIVSAYTDTSDILSAINVCRINHYLVKPITAQRLLDVVEAAMALVPLAAKYE